MSATASPVTETRAFTETMFELKWDSSENVGFRFGIIRNFHEDDEPVSSGMFLVEIQQGGPASNAGMTDNYLGYQIIAINNITVEGNAEILERLLGLTKRPNNQFKLRLRHIHIDEYRRRPYDTGLELN